MIENERYYRDFEGENGTIIRDRITNEEVFEFGMSDSKNLCDLLNEQEERIREVETRNQRQCERLKEITDLMTERDWESLEEIVEEWEESDRLLQAEWGTYGDVK